MWILRYRSGELICTVPVPALAQVRHQGKVHQTASACWFLALGYLTDDIDLKNITDVLAFHFIVFSDKCASRILQLCAGSDLAGRLRVRVFNVRWAPSIPLQDGNWIVKSLAHTIKRQPCSFDGQKGWFIFLPKTTLCCKVLQHQSPDLRNRNNLPKVRRFYSSLCEKPLVATPQAGVDNKHFPALQGPPPPS